jgi:hypothetical protein
VKRRLLTCIAALVLISSSSALATQPNTPLSYPPLRQALLPVHTVMAALATGNAQSIKDIYAPNAVVIDDVGSLRWNGTTAGQEWLANVDGQWGKFSRARFSALSAPADISFTDKETAYIVVYGTITSKTPDHPFRSHGSFTFTLSKASGSWRITSQTFSPLYVWGVQRGP